MDGEFTSILLDGEAATETLAEDIAAILSTGDLVALSGELGAGKTTFARAAIRALADDANLEVPSPTFTLVQTYLSDRLTVAHFDLYRLTSPDELVEVGLDDALADGAVLLEWPERAAGHLPENRLTIRFEITNGARLARLAGDEHWRSRIARTRAIRRLIENAGWAHAHRRPIRGDASTRRYERISVGNRSAILMDWPKPAAPPRRDSRAAWRAQDVSATLAVGSALHQAGLSVPAVLAADHAAGVVLMEDFGTEGIAVSGKPVPLRYETAIDALAVIHGRPRPATLPVPGGGDHRLLTLSPEVLAADLALFSDWYVAHATGKLLNLAEETEFKTLWRDALERTTRTEQSWVLFDAQSSNLFWLAAREGVRRIGFIDFQDMFVGPSAYDVVSLCQDARVTVSRELERELRSRYLAQRLGAGASFDAEAFSAAYAVLGLARASKNLGVFARQADHLGRTDYLQHVPRALDYTRRNLAHPVLSALALWYEKRLPPLRQAAG
jgi:tRNA threonylcarbamoyl adenosine modification protein YjeE